MGDGDEVTASAAAKRCVAVGALVAMAAAVAALPAAGREFSLSVKLIYPPNGAQMAQAPPGALTRVTLTHNVTGSCKLGEPFADTYVREKGSHGWGGTAASAKPNSATFYDPLPELGGRTHAFQWIVHAVCGEDVRTGADRSPGSGKGVDSEIRTFYLVPKAKKPSPCKAKIVYERGADLKINGDPASVGDEIGLGDTISTGSRTLVELKLGDKSLIRLGPETKLEVDLATCVIFGKSVEDRKVSLKLEVGNIWAKVAHAVGGDTKFDVHDSGGATYGVRGTVIEASYEPGRKLTRMRVDEGHGYLRSTGTGGKTVLLGAGDCSTVVNGRPPSTPSRCTPFFVWGGRRI